MEKKLLLRAVSLGIALTVAASALFSCTPGGKNLNGLQKVSLDHVYKVNYLESSLDKNSWIQSSASVGDDTYLIASYYNEIFVPSGGETPNSPSVEWPVVETFMDDETAETTETTETVTAEAVTNDVNIPVPASGFDIAVDDMTVETEDSETEAEGSYVYENGIRLLKVTADGRLEKVRDFVNSYENSEEDMRSSFTNYSTVAPVKDGKFWVLVNYGFDDWSDPQNYIYESSNKFVLYGADGTEEKSFDAREALAATLTEDEERNIYVDSFFVNSNDELVVYGNNVIAVLDSDGKLLRHSKTDENMWISSFVQLRDDEIVGMSYIYDSVAMKDERKIIRVNTENATVEEVGDVPFANAYNIFPSGEGGKVFVTNQSSLFLYDLSSGELSEEINWLNSDLNANRVNVITGLSDGSVLISENSRNYDSTRLARLTKVGDAVEKYVVNYASVYLDDDMTEAIISFNKQNEDYRVVYNDYSVYNSDEDYEAGIKQLNNDIIAGKIPDIFSLEGLELDVYASKGLLYDINNLIDKDKSFDRSIYYENILEATTIGGKLYSIIPSFTIETIVGKKSIVGDRTSWTMEDLKMVMEQYPDAVVFGSMTKSDILRYFMRLTLDKYIDSSSYTCHFDTPEFISVLEFIGSFPEEIDWDSYYSDMTEEDYRNEELQYYDNRTLLAYTYISKFYYPYQARMFLDEISYIGFPVPEGTGSAITPVTEIAVSSKSKGIDIAWEFIKFITSEEYSDENGIGFSINRKATEKMAAEALAHADKRRAELESSEGGEIGVTRPAVNGTTENGESTEDILDSLYRERLLTKEDVEELTRLVESVSSVARENVEVEKIITEEAAAYFSGQKSADSVAKTIQSKVFLYVSEGT